MGCIMKSVTIHSLKHETSKLLEQVESGESFEIRHYNKAVAVLKPFDGQSKDRLPDFRSQLRMAYGNLILEQTATKLICEER